MAKQIKYFCDICDKEFPPQEYSFLTGQIIKVSGELKPELLGFEGHYCDTCTHLIIKHIEELKNAKHSNTK